MRIGELARRAGVSVRSLRYYEEQGLLHSRRTPSGQRLYEEADVERVVLFQQLYDAGLSSRTIAELLPCVDAPSEASSDAALARMEEERVRLGERIEALLRARDTLDGVLRTARRHRERLRDRSTAESG
jgi:DNA-binding transcriptional MerR regulator